MSSACVCAEFRNAEDTHARANGTRLTQHAPYIKQGGCFSCVILRCPAHVMGAGSAEGGPAT